MQLQLLLQPLLFNPQQVQLVPPVAPSLKRLGRVGLEGNNHCNNKTPLKMQLQYKRGVTRLGGSVG
jgi:hypothetical protein